MAGLQERKKQDVRRKIVAVAGELFIRQGFDNTTMDQIAAEAAVARKTLYNYFPVKEAIADEYIRSISIDNDDEKRRALSDIHDTRSRLIAAISHRYDWLELNPELSRIVLAYRWKSLLQDPKPKVGHSGSREAITAILRESQDKGELAPDVSVERIADYLDFMRTVVVMDWLEDPGGVDLNKDTVRMVDLVLYGAFGGKGVKLASFRDERGP